MGESHPAWVCGLKRLDAAEREECAFVTPCVGVWIETVYEGPNDGGKWVTPCVGVWIETI